MKRFWLSVTHRLLLPVMVGLCCACENERRRVSPPLGFWDFLKENWDGILCFGGVLLFVVLSIYVVCCIEDARTRAAAAAEVRRIRDNQAYVASGLQRIRKVASDCARIKELHLVASDTLTTQEYKSFERHDLRARAKGEVLRCLQEMYSPCKFLMNLRHPPDPDFAGLLVTLMYSERTCRECRVRNGPHSMCPVVEEFALVEIKR